MIITDKALTVSACRGTYLIRIVEAVVHESCDQGRLSNCKRKNRQTALSERQEAFCLPLFRHTINVTAGVVVMVSARDVTAAQGAHYGVWG